MDVPLQDNQPSSLSNPAEIKDECFLLIELPEDDSLYKKKKKLLQDKGFSTVTRVFFQNISNLGSLNILLEPILQRTRIIHLNDLELYFGPMSVDSAQELYSPRNELESLNYVLSLVDLLIQRNFHKKKVVIQDLRDTIIKRIHNFGDQNKVETRVLKEACDNEKQIMSWAETCGVKSKLEIAHVKGAGRGALAAENIEIGEIALEIPVSIIISDDLVYESDMIDVLQTMDQMSTETMLLLWSMRERHNGHSKHKIYFDTLPEKFNTGLSFGVEAMMALDETLVSEEIFQAKEHLRCQYDELFPALCKYPDIFPPELYTWEQYLWACELWYSNSMKIKFPDGKIKTCLIPVAGFLNHSVCPHIVNYGKVDSDTNTLKFSLSRPCKKGEQCYLSYGNQSSSHLLTFYGFIPQEPNPYDVIPLDFEGAEKCDYEMDTTTHMVRGTWLSSNQEIFHYGVPSPLLEHLRKIHNPSLRTMKLLQENLENELRVLEDLSEIFDDMMERLGGSEKDDRKNPRNDVQLALQYRDLQRGIVSSILIACHNGSQMVKDELKKCMEEDVRG